MRYGVTAKLFCLVVAACNSNPQHIIDAGPDAPVEDVVRPRCEPPARSKHKIGLEPAFPNVTFDVPVDVVWAPHDPTRAYVVEYGGKVRVVDSEDADSARVFLDISHHVARFTGEVGLWDIAFHPSYPATPYVYAFWSGNGGSTDFRSVLTRYTTPDGGLTLDASSEQIVLSIERTHGAFHGGGKLGFSEDGLLWISTGDGDEFGDPNGVAQDPNTLLGKMLRIDVDGPAPYGIPISNPFAMGGGAPEVYALGFRNPWRWSFDRETGDVWLGDVGHHRVEEINRVVLGGNYGWNLREGSLCFASTPCDGDVIDPVHEYAREQGASVTGGYVYRGTAIPELAGRYVFGDYTTGRIWTLHQGQVELLLQSGLGLAAFAEDPAGELLVADIVAGRLHRLVATDTTSPGVPAAYLESTGCLHDDRAIDYEVNSPLWSDGLDKDRRIVLPEGTTARGQPDGHWELPDDTVLIKTFRHEGRPVETRLLFKQAEGWTGWSYQWFANGTYAQRLDGGAITNIGDRDWYFPSSTECTRCHSAAAGYALGVHQAQLDLGTQLEDLRNRGVFDGVTATVPALRRLDDASAPLSARARSYLHVNCAMCHQPGGPATGNLDLRFGTPLAETNACDRAPSFGDVGLGENARLIAPGDPARSVLLSRIARRDEFRMPPLATLRVDAEAVAVVTDWIGSLTSCAE